MTILPTSPRWPSISYAQNCKNITDIGRIFLAYIRPKTPFGYIGIVAIGILGTSAIIIGKKVHKFFYKRRHRSAFPLELTQVEKYPQAFDKAFERIKLHPAYPLFLLTKGFSNEQARDYFRKAMPLGTCLGQVLELLNVTAQHPHHSCPELLKSVNISNVYYYQMLHEIKADFEQIQGNRIIQELEAACIILKEHLYSAITKLSPFHEGSLPVKSYSAMLPENDETRGCIFIVFQEKLRLNCHAIFFQSFSEKHGRFYDPINPSEGFYEYDDQKSFFEALRSQILEIDSHAQFQWLIAGKIT